ncbi:MAG: aminopeptidase P family protein [Caldibacillus debilis]|jgi:Xaa-Pro aminopeptidase|uniref:Xaa-Pro aminopeptidase n=1 Tax=Caldibacillus debilis GB1 TaxID=1339248 RepID=A0A420VED3_9BACI|nr:Xaa-Pro peptidase family protein [Caldibacillus debilis]MBO2481596.1 aminopeptidase P family protein [Bacillaceae bacterium]MBY6271616.1 aminopeptidase P family protein [Bacillaceae bacterium]REJ20493.1 MAG: aminopeptidase P family protein [Caldibacillus debilis]REJ28189.1 MAG: aminopeptidase P family protein [Caldibacillus debilis]RKO62014.1 Xaa-Pro aminopeptidase [Caldibacillus debilis GB1]
MEKLEKIRKKISELGVDGLLIMSPSNRRYVSGFTGTAGAALITLDEAFFITDFRYVEQAKKQAPDFTVVRHKGSIIEEVKNLCSRKGWKRIGFEEQHVTYALYREMENRLPAELVPVSGAVEKLRLIKSEAEIKIIKVAADIADAAFKHILDYIKPGVTEMEVANELEHFMKKCGASAVSFETIVASGHRSALPHGVASEKVIEKGDMVTLDYGAVYQGYVSDITRTVSVGEPSDTLKEIYGIVLEAQRKGVEAIRPGMTGKEADAVCRSYIAEKGYGEYFGHSTGHGIGLEVHEGPALSERSDEVLAENMVVTVEPGIYLPGVGGVRIEDDILLSEKENIRLTHSTKELIVL